MGCRKLQLPAGFHLVKYHHEAHEVHEDDFSQNHSIKYRAARFTYDNLGRRTAMHLKNTSTGSSEVSALYSYDAMNRIASVSDGTNTATYTRVPGKNMLDTTTITRMGNPPVVALTTTRNYDSLNRLTSIAATLTGQAAKSYSYQYNDRDQRTRLTLLIAGSGTI